MITLLFIFITLVWIYNFGFKYSAKRISNSTTPPDTEFFKPYYDILYNDMVNLASTKYENVAVTSFDGLHLTGRYYHLSDDAPTVIILHGYRSRSDSDCAGGFALCRKLGYNILLPNHRSHGRSEGKTITFGVYESRDCLSWVDYLLSRNADAKILLMGVSMGAATVLMTAGYALPSNVVGIAADCPYSSPREIVRSVISNHLKLPVRIYYPLTKLSARLFGGFGIESLSAVEAVKKCRLPLLLIHGESDSLVPCDMSREIFEASAATDSDKKLITVPGAEHGMSYCVDHEKYERELVSFCDRIFKR